MTRPSRLEPPTRCTRRSRSGGARRWPSSTERRCGTAARAQLEEQRLGALEDRIDADLALGRHADLIHELDALVAEHPYRERFRAQQMLALYRSGRQADALAAYRSAREAFVDGLGIEPGAELKALERQVLDQDPALAAPAPSPPPSRKPAEAPTPVVAVALLALVGAAVAAAFCSGGEPAAITVEPNWVAVIDPKTNEVVDAVPAGVGPGPIAFGGGAVWVGNLDGKSVTRIDPASRKVVETIPLDATPTGSGVRPRQALGRARPHGAGHLDRSRARRQGDDRRRREDEVRVVARGRRCRGPMVWAVFGDATLARIDPKSSDVERTDVGLRPTGCRRGRRLGLGRQLRQLDGLPLQSGHLPRRPARPMQRRQPVDRDRLRHDAVWVTSSGDDVVRAIDSASTYATRQIHVGAEPVAVAVGAGAVWVANAGDGTVSRIDPATGEVVQTIEVGEQAGRGRGRRTGSSG